MSDDSVTRNDDRLADYVDVPERIRRFYERYPEGRLTREGEPEVMEVGGKPFIVYKAKACRYPADPIPGKGVAWEPFPGPTPFTKDSELMNAETAAWGRAIVAVGILAHKEGIASREEVKARGGGSSSSAAVSVGPATADNRISEGKVRRAFALRKAHNFTEAEWQHLLSLFAVQTPEQLHFKSYDGFCEYLERKKPMPDPDHPSDVPLPEEPAEAPADGAEIPF